MDDAVRVQVEQEVEARPHEQDRLRNLSIDDVLKEMRRNQYYAGHLEIGAVSSLFGVRTVVWEETLGMSDTYEKWFTEGTSTHPVLNIVYCGQDHYNILLNPPKNKRIVIASEDPRLHYAELFKKLKQQAKANTPAKQQAKAKTPKCKKTPNDKSKKIPNDNNNKKINRKEKHDPAAKRLKFGDFEFSESWTFEDLEDADSNGCAIEVIADVTQIEDKSYKPKPYQMPSLTCASYELLLEGDTKKGKMKIALEKKSRHRNTINTLMTSDLPRSIKGVFFFDRKRGIRVKPWGRTL